MIELSCAFATSLATPDHVALAEQLGYRRAWLYDSPALYPDVWAMLALCAERTSRIAIGPAVLVPSLRHPITNAAAIATLVALAPGRVEVAIGSGFTGRMTLGKRPLSWKYVRHYVEALQGLLQGEEVTWDGGVIQMMHPEGFAPARPIRVPMLLGAGGPKGEAAAAELADGMFVAGGVPPAAASRAGRCAVLTFGTVLEAGEDAGSPRAMNAAGHAGAVALHAMYERGSSVAGLPGGADWTADLEAIPAARRHLALHDLHLIGLTERDARIVTGELLEQFGAARTAEGWASRLAELEAQGATEIAYQPAGGDIPGELRRFAAAAAAATTSG